jgi:hypothetical protein
MFFCSLELPKLGFSDVRILDCRAIFLQSCFIAVFGMFLQPLFGLTRAPSPLTFNRTVAFDELEFEVARWHLK